MPTRARPRRAAAGQAEEYSSAVWPAEQVSEGGVATPLHPHPNRRDHNPVYLAPLRMHVLRTLEQVVADRATRTPLGEPASPFILVKGAACTGKSVLLASLVHALRNAQLAPSPPAPRLVSFVFVPGGQRPGREADAVTPGPGR